MVPAIGLAMLVALGLAPDGALASQETGAATHKEADVERGMTFTDAKTGQAVTIDPGQGVYWEHGKPVTVDSAQAVIDAVRAKAANPNLPQAERDAALAVAGMLEAANSRAVVDMVNEAVRNYGQQRSKPVR